MLLIVAVAAVTVASLAITFFLTDRSHWRKILLGIGIAGAALSSLQAYNNGERADDLQNRLARLKAPRALTTEQRERVIEKMKTFAGTTFDFGANGDSEPLGLVDLIEDILRTAGWNEINWAGTQTISRSGGREVGMIFDSGVVVGIEQQKKTELLPVAKALASALSLEGITAEEKFTGGVIPNTNQNAIHIMVGTKP